MNERKSGTAKLDVHTAGRQIFDRYFPTGTLETISLQEIPKDAVKYFETKSMRYIDVRNYTPGNFSATWVITHENGDRTYVAKQTQTYATSKDTETLLYLVDMRGNEKIGYGEVRYNISNPSLYFVHKPFVGYTYTDAKPEFRRQGLGTRRLFVMNALSHMLYGHSLNSDTNIAREAEGVWKKLMRQGQVRTYKEGPHNRYVFNK